MIDDMEVIVFKIITASGIAKGLAYKALDKVENRDFKGAYKLLGEANEYIDEAHEIQKGIIEDEVTGNAIEISTLLIHAQDHFMIAMEVITMVERMIKLYKIIFKEIYDKIRSYVHRCINKNNCYNYCNSLIILEKCLEHLLY